jgi:hypothetical protein
MKTFKEYILEEVLSTQEAEGILGLSGEYDPADVKKAYRHMSKIHHPDKGGDNEMMKKVNAAWKTLKGGKGSKSDLVISKKEWKARAQFIADDINNNFDEQAFLDYFKLHLGRNFKCTRKVINNDHWAGLLAKFETKDGKIAFDLDISAYLAGAELKGGLSNSKTISYTIMVVAYGYANRKKQKMSQRDWAHKHDHIVLSDPSKTFPVGKMKKIAASSGTTNMKRADFKLAIKNELHGEDWILPDSYLIPVKDGFIRINRNVIMRVAYWSLTDVGNKIGNYKFDAEYTTYHTVLESEDTIELLLSYKNKTMKQVAAHIAKLKKAK